MRRQRRDMSDRSSPRNPGFGWYRSASPEALTSTGSPTNSRPTTAYRSPCCRTLRCRDGRSTRMSGASSQSGSFCSCARPIVLRPAPRSSESLTTRCMQPGRIVRTSFPGVLRRITAWSRPHRSPRAFLIGCAGIPDTNARARSSRATSASSITAVMRSPIRTVSFARRWMETAISTSSGRLCKGSPPPGPLHRLLSSFPALYEGTQAEPGIVASSCGGLAQPVRQPLNRLPERQLRSPLGRNRVGAVQRASELSVDGAGGIGVLTEIDRGERTRSERVGPIQRPERRLERPNDVAAPADRGRLAAHERTRRYLGHLRQERALLPIAANRRPVRLEQFPLRDAGDRPDEQRT